MSLHASQPTFGQTYKNDAVVNYMAVLRNCTLYLEAQQTSQQGHEHIFIANNIEPIFTTYNDTKLAGAATGNTSAHKKVWDVLKDKYQSSFFYGCTSRSLHLLVKNIFCALKTMKAGSTKLTYPSNYQFEEILLFINEGKNIFLFFHNYHVTSAQLEEMPNATRSQALVRPCETWWRTIWQTCKPLLSSEQHPHAIVPSQDFIKGSSAQKKERELVKDTVINTASVALLKKAIAILEPIYDLITKSRSNKVPISEVLSDHY